MNIFVTNITKTISVSYNLSSLFLDGGHYKLRSPGLYRRGVSLYADSQDVDCSGKGF